MTPTSLPATLRTERFPASNVDPQISNMLGTPLSITSARPGVNEAALTERLYHANEILADPILASTLTTFVNKGFMAQSEIPHAVKIWADSSTGRFKSPNEINEMLGPNGIFAVIYDGETPVAVAGGVPWKQGLQELALERETGYEIKTVTVDPKVVKRGLATRCMEIVIKKLIEVEKKKRDESGIFGDGKMKLWIQSTEYVNGDYWRGRGYKDVRNYEMPAGFWSARIPFTLLVQAREVDIA